MIDKDNSSTAIEAKLNVLKEIRDLAHSALADQMKPKQKEEVYEQSEVGDQEQGDKGVLRKLLAHKSEGREE